MVGASPQHIHNQKEDKVRKLNTALLVFVLAALMQTQNYSQFFGLTQTPSGFYNPLGPDATRNGYGDWLSRSGTYTTPFYHVGQDMLVTTPVNMPAFRNGIGHQVYAIADGEIYYISTSEWGSTDCGVIRTVLPNFDPGCNAGQSKKNVAIFVRHKTMIGDFMAIYGHVIDYNLLTGKSFDNKDSKDARAAVHTLVSKGQAFAVLGGWPPPHLHFSIYPTFPPSYPVGNKGRGADTDAPNYTNLATGKPYVVEWRSVFGQADPVQFVTTNAPNNYITAQATVNQTATPSSVTIPLGGVGVIPWQATSLQGFTGTIQGNVVVRPGVTGNNLKIKPVMTQPQVLGSGQTAPLQSLVYVPSTMSIAAYTADIQTATLDNTSNPGVSLSAALTLQTVGPPPPPSSAPPNSTAPRSTATPTWSPTTVLENTSDSKGSYTLTNNGGVQFSASKFNSGADGGNPNTTKALYLTKTSGVASGPDSATQLSTAFSVSSWVKMTAKPGAGAEAVFWTLIPNTIPPTSAACI